MPLRNLHQSKKEAIFQLCNFISSSSISELKDLADGKFLQKTIRFRFPEFLNKAENGENDALEKNAFTKVESSPLKNIRTQTGNRDESSTLEDTETKVVEKGESITVESIETKVVKKNDSTKVEDTEADIVKIYAQSNVSETDIKNPENISYTPSSAVNPVVPHVDDNEDILQRYVYIQKFIDDRYHLKSEEVISYKKCMKIHEFELAKVAIFVLSEIVKCLIHENNEHLQTLFHLDMTYQEELEECFKLFISEREKISKSEVERTLSKSARNESSFVTPRRSCRSRYREQLKSVATPTMSTEEVFTNSPLKSFFESPVFKKEDIMVKDKEIENMHKMLVSVDEKSEKLEYKLEKISEQFNKKDLENKQMKKALADLKKEIEDIEKQKELLEKEKTSLENENKVLETERKKLEKELLKKNESFCEVECQVECRSDLCKTEKKRTMKEVEAYMAMKNHLQEELLAASKQINELRMNSSNLNSHSLNLNSHEEWEDQDPGPDTDPDPDADPEIQERKRKLPDFDFDDVLRSKEQKIKTLTETLIQVEQKLKEAQKEAFCYKRKLSRSILSELKKTATSPGDLNQTYEDVWKEETSSLMSGENIGCFIEEENKSLQAKLKEAELKYENLLKEVEYLKRQNRQRNIRPAASISMPQLIDMSHTPEIEKLRHSINQSGNFQEQYHLSNEAYVLNNSNIGNGQLLTMPQSEINPHAENISEAVLWKQYDSQYESNTINCINHGLNTPESSKLDFINILPENSIKPDITDGDDILPVPENIYMYENLNFNSFLNSLKRLSTNGSFKKVLQVFENVKSELKLKKTSKTNGSKGLDLQDLLNIITECISAATASHTNLQDKSCLAIHSENESAEIGRLKFQIKDMAQKQYIQLKEYKEKIEKLKNDKSTLEAQNKDYLRRVYSANERLEEFQEKYAQLKIEFSEKVKKYLELKEICKKLKEANIKKTNDISSLKNKILQMHKSNREHEKFIKKLRVERDGFKLRDEKLNKELINKNNVIKVLEERLRISLETKLSCTSKANIENIEHDSPELLSSLVQDTGTFTESFVSGTFCNKTSFQFVSHDEENFLNVSSLVDIKKDYEDERVQELKRRNSVLPLHLQTSYPIESNLRITESLYVMDNLKSSRLPFENHKENDEHYSKKRKLTDMDPDIPSCSLTTPVAKVMKESRPAAATNSLKKLLHLSRRRPSSGRIRPKP